MSPARFVVACCVALIAGSTGSSAAEQTRKLGWVCSIRGSYSVEMTDDGRGALSGNPLSGTNRLLFEVTVPTGGQKAHFQLSAFVNNKILPQMPSDGKQVIDVQMEIDEPVAVRAMWLDIASIESVSLEKSEKTWRFVHTTSTIIDDETAKKAGGKPGPQVSMESGDCVLAPKS